MQKIFSQLEDLIIHGGQGCIKYFLFGIQGFPQMMCLTKRGIVKTKTIKQHIVRQYDNHKKAR